MADFTGAQYTVDEVLAGIKKNQITGLPPSNLTVKSVRVGDGKATISWSVPAKTVVDGQVLQTTGGIMIRRKLGEAPRSITDGDQVLISTDTVGSFEDNGLVNDQEYFYRFFPFSDHGVYNLNPENVVSAVPKAYVLYGFTIDKNNSDPAGRVLHRHGRGLHSSQEQPQHRRLRARQLDGRHLLPPEQPRLDGQERRHP